MAEIRIPKTAEWKTINPMSEFLVMWHPKRFYTDMCLEDIFVSNHLFNYWEVNSSGNLERGRPERATNFRTNCGISRRKSSGEGNSNNSHAVEVSSKSARQSGHWERFCWRTSAGNLCPGNWYFRPFLRKKWTLSAKSWNNLIISWANSFRDAIKTLIITNNLKK